MNLAIYITGFQGDGLGAEDPNTPLKVHKVYKLSLENSCIEDQARNCTEAC